MQNAAHALLVAIGQRFVKLVFDQLEKNLSPVILPHLSVLNTMASLAETKRTSSSFCLTVGVL